MRTTPGHPKDHQTDQTKPHGGAKESDGHGVHVAMRCRKDNRCEGTYKGNKKRNHRPRKTPRKTSTLLLITPTHRAAQEV